MGRRTHEGIRTDRSVVSKKEHEGGGRGVGGARAAPSLLQAWRRSCFGHRMFTVTHLR